MAYYYTPFRKKYNRKKNNPACPFCDEKLTSAETVKYADQIPVENKSYRWIVNMFPKFEGHTMVVPKKHVTSLGTESAQETKDRDSMIKFASETLQKLYPNSGFEVFLQAGSGSEASINHLHWHVVPSHPSDPIRGFDKLGQFFTIDEEKPKILVFPVPIKKARHTLLKALSKTLGRKRA